jgi:hypothetical protein
MASIQLTIPSFQPPETKSLAEARRDLVDRLHSAVRTLNVALFSVNTTGDLSDSDIEKSYESLAWAIDSLREEQALARLDNEIEGSFPPFSGGVLQEGVRQ